MNAPQALFSITGLILLLCLIFGGCTSASKYHPVLICMPVAAETIACVDAEQLKAEQSK